MPLRQRLVGPWWFRLAFWWHSRQALYHYNARERHNWALLSLMRHMKEAG